MWNPTNRLYEFHNRQNVEEESVPDFHGGRKSKQVHFRNENLWSFARQGDLDSIDKILTDYPALVTENDPFGYTALHYAAEKDHADTVEFLLNRGADPNRTTDREGTSPLYLAAAFGNINALRALYNWCQKKKVTLIVDGSADKVNQWSPLHAAVDGGHTSCVQFLVTKVKNVNINEKDYWGRTPLHLLIEKRSDAVLAVWLVSKGAIVSIEEKVRLPPMYESGMWASQMMDLGGLPKKKNPPYTPAQKEGDDVCFITKDDKGESKKLFANSQLLSEKSEFFRSMLAFYKESKKDGMLEIPVVETPYPVFLGVMEWLYNKTLTTKQFDLILEIWETAHVFRLTPLSHYCRKQLVNLFKERQQRVFKGEGISLSQSVFFHEVNENITFLDYLLKLFDGIGSSLDKSDESSDLDIPLKGILANCLLLDLKNALGVYQGDPVQLVSQLFRAVDIMAGQDAKEIFDGGNSFMIAEVKKWKDACAQPRPQERIRTRRPLPVPIPKQGQQGLKPVRPQPAQQPPQQAQQPAPVLPPKPAAFRTGGSFSNRVALWENKIKEQSAKPVAVLPKEAATNKIAEMQKEAEALRKKIAETRQAAEERKIKLEKTRAALLEKKKMMVKQLQAQKEVKEILQGEDDFVAIGDELKDNSMEELQAKEAEKAVQQVKEAKKEVQKAKEELKSKETQKAQLMLSSQLLEWNEAKMKASINLMAVEEDLSASSMDMSMSFSLSGNEGHLKVKEKEKEEEQQALRVLSLDSAGMRTLHQLRWLKKLQKRATQKSVVAYDIVVGVGFGALVALGLAANKTLRDIELLVLDIQRLVFVADNNSEQRHNDKELSKLLNAFFGTLKLADVKNPKPAVIAILQKVDSGDIVQIEVGDKKPEGALFAEVALAAISLQPFLPPVKLGNEIFCDASWRLSNPAMLALTEGHKEALFKQKVDLLSVGGCHKPLSSVPPFGSPSIVIDHMVSLLAENVHSNIQSAREAANMGKGAMGGEQLLNKYLRIELDKKVDIEQSTLAFFETDVPKTKEQVHKFEEKLKTLNCSWKIRNAF